MFFADAVCSGHRQAAAYVSYTIKVQPVIRAFCASETSVMTSLVKAMPSFVGSVEVTSETVARSHSPYERAMTADKVAGEAWSDKLDRVNNTLGTRKVATTRPKTVASAKLTQVTQIDLRRPILGHCTRGLSTG